METGSEDSEKLQRASSLSEGNASVRRKDARNLKAATSYFCLSDHLADVWFAFKDSSTKLPAHKLLLSMRSEVFEAMFYGSLAERSHTITVEDIDIQTMKMILRYIYSDDAQLDGKNVTGCLYVAKKYALYGLVDKCTEFLTDAVAAETACTIYEQAKIYDEVALQTKCLDYIADNIADVCLNEDFLTLTYESLMDILKSDYLSSEELSNFHAVIFWAHSECKKKNMPASQENLRAKLGDILFLIRFPLMAIDTFAKEVAPTKILTNEEMLMMYQYLATMDGSQEKENVGRFSCSKRALVMKFDHLNLSANEGGGGFILNTSTRVQLVSMKGSFVPHVIKITVDNIDGWNEAAAFHIKGDRLDLLEPVLVSPQFGYIKISFQMEIVEGSIWSANLNSSHRIRNTTVMIKRVPAGLKSLVFKEALI